ncbi:hypothetical protein [Rhodospirillum sp. A1_3_36]|uniref:hypothetical protein n=1 Tax=Rhodospirillum sp. A1_3_36 TaxID=3391666 RepID=UPI0039A5EC3D
MFPNASSCDPARCDLPLSELLAQDPYSLHWWGLVFCLAFVAVGLVLALGFAGMVCDDALRKRFPLRSCPYGIGGDDAPFTMLGIGGAILLIVAMITA